MNRVYGRLAFSVLTLLGSLAIYGNDTQCSAWQLKSATVLEFAGANTLIVADPVQSQLVAFELPEAEKAEKSTSYNVVGFGQKVAAAFEVGERAITYNDIAVHPNSKQVYVSVSIVSDGQVRPAIAIADSSGSVTVLNLDELKFKTKTLTETADDGVQFWRDIPATTFTVTDLDYVNGNLFVSGLSTGEFASTLRKIPFPFSENSATSKIEIYHTVHDQTETRAPIRAMTVIDLAGEETVVAAYTCTPLVTIPVGALKDGAHVKGKTVAELGYGNTPLDVVDFIAMNNEQKPEHFVLVVNKERSADLIRVKDLEVAEKKEGLSTPEMWAHAGVPSRPLPLGGVLQVADQDEQFLLTLKRNLTSGDIDLLSYRKGAYFRLNDFVSEYNFPDYEYEQKQDFFRNFQNMLKTDAGYSDLIRERKKK